MRRVLIALNNRLVRWRRVRVPASRLLLLAPHCLQRGGCGRPVSDDWQACGRCGRCDVAALVELCERAGIRGCLAGGGQLAAEQARRPDIWAVVAVACERELWQGVCAAFPKPVYAVCNRRPHGPCRDTAVDVGRVRDAVERMLLPS